VLRGHDERKTAENGPSASFDEQADRKIQLLKGPEEFRNTRIDNGSWIMTNA
jgi:hypothetical protein